MSFAWTVLTIIVSADAIQNGFQGLSKSRANSFNKHIIYFRQDFFGFHLNDYFAFNQNLLHIWLYVDMSTLYQVQHTQICELFKIVIHISFENIDYIHR